MNLEGCEREAAKYGVSVEAVLIANGATVSLAINEDRSRSELRRIKELFKSEVRARLYEDCNFLFCRTSVLDVREEAQKILEELAAEELCATDSVGALWEICERLPPASVFRYVVLNKIERHTEATSRDRERVGWARWRVRVDSKRTH